jgi:hypothetical protein
MRLNDLFEQDLLNPKPILLGGGYNETIEKTTKTNSEAILLATLFGLTTLLIVLNFKTYESRRKEN